MKFEIYFPSTWSFGQCWKHIHERGFTDYQWFIVGTNGWPTREGRNSRQQAAQITLPFDLTAIVTRTLNLLPEVRWDRWTGDLDSEDGIGVFGWIPRDDGKSDFISLRIGEDGVTLMQTSSAKYSAEFAHRLFPDSDCHGDCKRVEHFFPAVNCIKL